MAFAVTDLLLTDDRQAQLSAALVNLGVADPLAKCIEEAQALVADYTSAYTLAATRQNSFIRAVALWKAYTYAETGVPEDVQNAYESALKELEAIRDGKFNLPAASSPPTTSAAGGWGSEKRF